MVHRSLAIVVVACVAVACTAGSCGGEGIEAPKVLAPDEPAGACPSSDAVLVSLRTQIQDGAFDGLRPHLERILVDERGLATMLSLLSQVLPELEGPEVKTLLASLTGEDGKATLDALKTHVINVLEYVHGTSPFLPGEHLAPLAAMHEILLSCDAPESMQMLRDLFALEVRRGGPGPAPAWEIAAPGTGESSWLLATLRVLSRAAKNPTAAGLLENIEIAEDGTPDGADIRIGRDAFLVLAKLLAANVSAPDFELGPTRELLDDVLLPQLHGDAEAEALLDELLDLLGLLVDRGSVTFQGMQAFMGCVDRHDSEAAIPGMLFDYLTIDELPVDALIDDAVAASDTASAGAARVAVVQILDATLAHPAALGDATVVVGKLIDPAVAPTLLSTVLSLKGTGTLTELSAFVDDLLSCKQVLP